MPPSTKDAAAPGMVAILIAQVRPACTVLVALAVITGILYPLGMNVAIQALFPRQAAGSAVRDATGAIRGSQLIGQPFTGAQWFHGRPSATGNAPYDPTASGGSNLGPTSPALAAAAGERAAALTRENPSHAGPVPIDLVTASGSGLDPHISPPAALLQVPRVAAARGLDPSTVQRLVDQHVERPFLGVLGRPRVNVLRLNLALESEARPAEPARQE